MVSNYLYVRTISGEIPKRRNQWQRFNHGNVRGIGHCRRAQMK